MSSGDIDEFINSSLMIYAVTEPELTSAFQEDPPPMECDQSQKGHHPELIQLLSWSIPIPLTHR